MKNILGIALLLTACAFIISLVYNPLAIPSLTDAPLEDSGATIELAGESIRAFVADTREERTKGLSGREGLGSDEGMLFVFPEDGTHSFWMKDMHFSIDIIWISQSGDIVDIRESVSPESYPTVFTPRREARYVLELPQGWVKEHSVRLGDMVGL